MRQLFVLLLTFTISISQVAPKSQACFLDMFTGPKGREARRLAFSLQNQNLKADDHIPQFSALVLDHIEHIGKGLKNLGSPTAEEALNKLENLRIEAHQRVTEEKVSYRWWVVFNFRLAAISSLGLGEISQSSPPVFKDFFEKLVSSSDSHEETLKTLSKMPVLPGIEADLNMYLEEFPRRVFVPTIATLDLADFNERRSSGAYFLGIENSFAMAHSNKMSPLEFLFHDLVHALIAKDEAGDWRSKVYARYAKTLEEDKRAALDIVYFLWDHETEIPRLFESDYSGSYSFGPDAKFCNGCSKNSILAFLPSEVVALGEQASVAWMNEAIKETRAFFDEHQPEVEKSEL